MQGITGRYIPTGLRSLGPTEYQMAQRIEDFSGLTEPKPGSLLALVKQAAPALTISEKCLYLLDQLMAYTQAQDWLPGRRPIVWPSNERLVDSLDIHVRALQYRLRALRDAGLIVAVYGPQERRYGRRGPDGHIIEAYGFDLSPLALRAEEFKGHIEKLAQQRAQRKALRKRRTVAIKDLKRLSAAALDSGLDETQWQSIADQGRAIALTSRTRKIPVLQQAADALEHLLADAQHLYETQIQLVISAEEQPISAPEGAKICATNTTTTDFLSNKLDTVDNKNSSATVRSDELINATIKKYKIRPSMISRMSHFLGQLLPPESIQWSHITSLATQTYRSLHIPDHTWHRAVNDLGILTASVLLTIVIAKRRDIHSTKAYFQALVSRGVDDKLNIGPTLFALRDRAKAELA